MRFLAAAGLLLVADCRCKAQPDPSPQITTNLVAVEDAGEADVVDAQAAVPCAEPKKIVVVGEVHTVLRWVYGSVLTDDTNEYDLATLAQKPFVRLPDESPEDAGVAIPSGGHFRYVDGDRWIVFQHPHSDSFNVIDRTTRREFPATFEYVHHSRALQLFPGGTVAVIDLATGKELIREHGCKSDMGVGEPYALSENGAFLECWLDRNARTAFVIGDPARRTEKLNAMWDYVSPDETYIVGVPISTLGRTTLEHHAVLDPPKTISTDVDPPDWYRHMKVSFCGTGRIFAAYAVHAGQRPSRVLVFRGSDGALLTSAPSAGSREPEREGYLDFNAAGTHMILLQSVPGSPATTVLFRLEQ